MINLKNCQLWYTRLMAGKQIIIWCLMGLVLIFLQSFFLRRWLVLPLVVVLSWKEDEPWRPILIISLIDDLFLAQTFGKGLIIYLITAFLVRGGKRITGLGKSVRVKVNHF